MFAVDMKDRTVGRGGDGNMPVWPGSDRAGPRPRRTPSRHVSGSPRGLIGGTGGVEVEDEKNES
jgi:hypothetical protein